MLVEVMKGQAGSGQTLSLKQLQHNSGWDLRDREADSVNG